MLTKTGCDEDWVLRRTKILTCLGSTWDEVLIITLY